MTAGSSLRALCPAKPPAPGPDCGACVAAGGARRVDRPRTPMKSTEPPPAERPAEAEAEEVGDAPQVHERISRILDIVNGSSKVTVQKATPAARKKAQGKSNGKSRKEEDAPSAEGRPKSNGTEKGRGKGKDGLSRQSQGGKDKDAVLQSNEVDVQPPDGDGQPCTLVSKGKMWIKKSTIAKEVELSSQGRTGLSAHAKEFTPFAPELAPVRSAINAEAPAFVPQLKVAEYPSEVAGLYMEAEAVFGVEHFDQYQDPGWPYPVFWPSDSPMPGVEPDFPEVVHGTREGEFLGLQIIAEMGEWVVFREKKPKARPFFWNMSTGEKSWEAPVILQELGVADTLLKWSEDLGETGIEPSPDVRNPEPFRRRDRFKPKAGVCKVPPPPPPPPARVPTAPDSFTEEHAPPGF